MEPGLNAVLAVMAGGGLGGLARAWLCARLPGTLGVLVVNATGCFALGLLAAQAAPFGPLWVFWATGVLGGFTTVSSFALQSVQIWQAGSHVRALGNIAGSVILSLMAVALGLWVGAP